MHLSPRPSSFRACAGLRMLLACVALCASLPAPSLAAPPPGTQAPCPIPAGIGAPSWVLASLPYIDLCALLESVSVAPSPTAPPEVSDVPTEHVVEEGETLSEIAQLYGTTAEILAELNGLEDPYPFAIGMRLVLPRSEALPTAEPVHQVTVQQAAACGQQVAEYVLDLPAEASRVAAFEGTLYLLAGGELYGLPLEQVSGSDRLLQPTVIRPTEDQVGGIALQELMDLAVDETSRQLVLLNKVGDLFGYQPEDKRWSVRMRASSVPGLWIDPQYLAITQLASVTYSLDVDNASLWRLVASATYPELFGTGSAVAAAVDVASLDGSVLLLDRDGTIRTPEGDAYASGLERLGWAAELCTSPDGLLAVDGDGRRVVLMDGDRAVDVQLRVPGMQRVRTATASKGVIYAVAGRTLYQVRAWQSRDACQVVPYDDRWIFADLDLDASIPELTLPFDGGVLPNRPRSYPGARRMYRYGIHEGVDFYPGDAPGLAYGSPVAAIAAGTVIRIDHDFAEITAEAYDPMMAEIEALHRTPDHLLDRLRGQQVWIEHAPGVVSRYAHLSGVAEDLQVGDHVEAGQFLGRVGASGTSDGVYNTREGYHLHWEIWINGRYLGQGLTIPETMRLWKHLF